MAVTIPQAATVVASGEITPGERWANVFHVSIGTGGFGVADAGDLNTIFFDYYNGVKARRGSAWKMTRITVRDIREEGRETFIFDTTAVTGGLSTPILPPQVSLVVTLRSATNSRRGRGRTYLSGFITTHMDAQTGQANSTVLTAEANAFEVLGEDLLANTTPLAIASRTAGQLFFVETININSVWDTQRRRSKDLVPQSNLARDIT